MSKIKKKKFYVVWEGRQTGVFGDWPTCHDQIQGYSNARYKSFDSRSEAERAWQHGEYQDYVSTGTSTRRSIKKFTWNAEMTNGPIIPSWSVDAACSGNPGMLEYRGVFTETGEELFHVGPLVQGTNNIGEFLAIVHALALSQKQENILPIYTDSKIAMNWVKSRQCRTKLEQEPDNERIFQLLERAETWLQQNTYTNRILHWNTQAWGEIPADFGRK